MDQNSPEINSSPIPSESGKSNSRQHGILIAILAVILIIGGVGALFVRGIVTKSDKTQTKDTNQKSDSTAKDFIADKAILYGYWTPTASIIGLSDLSNNSNSTITSLPFNIKHVVFSAPESLIYINNTNAKDHGEELLLHNIRSNTKKTLKKADIGYGIDDYVVSPNNKYAVVWEIQIPAGQVALTGGKSQVYQVEVDSGAKKLLYSEEMLPGVPVHYPLAVTNDGAVYLDTFSPNSGAGWAYGMSAIGSNGTKNEMPAMINGTYSSQPLISADGSKMIFIGYDQSKGQGDMVVDGFRRAFLFPNTIESYDTRTGNRDVLVRAGENNFIASLNWDEGKIVYSKVSKDAAESGYYEFDETRKTSTPLGIKGEDLMYRGHLQDGTMLLGTLINDDSGVGNLSKKYEPVYTSLVAYDMSKGVSTAVPSSGQGMQIISIQESSVFSSIAAVADTSKGQSMQLSTFTLKEELSPQRQQQQSEGGETSSQKCYELYTQQCNAQLGTRHPANKLWRDSPDQAFAACMQSQFKVNRGLDVCVDSPLYLYGPVGTKFLVHSGTPLFRPNVDYSDAGGFQVEIGNNGVVVGGKHVTSIDFDYESADKISPPKYGRYIKKSEIETVFRKFSADLGFNEGETEDTVAKAKELIEKPYAFVSFYDEVTSKRILPLFFSPQPDNYHNIVFYIKNVDSVPQNMIIGTFPIQKIIRTGTTAVEISFVVE